MHCCLFPDNTVQNDLMVLFSRTFSVSVINSSPIKCDVPCFLCGKNVELP